MNCIQVNCIQPFLKNNPKILYNYIIILFKLSGKKRLLKLVKVLLASIKSANPIQKYPHTIASYACILKIFVIIIDLSINLLISFGICSTPKLSK